MKTEIQRAIVRTGEPTLVRETGTALMKGGGTGLAVSAVLGVLPFVGVWTFIPVVALMMLVLGGYLYVRG